ncbi:MAG: UbiA family prenyltransferase [candidate division WOR-3 bacterium]
MRRIIEYIDNQNPLKATVVIILSIVLRGIFEGTFENARNLHFQVSLYKAFLFFFLHQFSFYFAAFLIITLVVAVLSKKSVFKAYNFVATFSFIITIPPLIDSLSGGGYVLKYIFSEEEFWATVFNFFNPFFDLSPVGITYGMRIEITLAIIGVFLYVLLTSKNLINSLIAGILTFFVLLFLGSVPYFFLSFFKISHAFAFKSYSLLYEDTQRYSILNLMVLTLVLCFITLLYDSKKAITLFTLRIQKLPFYISLGIVGFVLGYKISGHLWPHPFKNPFDYVALLGMVIALTLSHHFGVLINDINDYEIDKINGKKTSVNGGGLTLNEARVSAGVMFVLALAFYLSLNFDTFILGLATLGLAWIYSVEPLRTKRLYLLSTLTLASISVFCQFIGASLWMKEKTILLYPKDVVLATFLGVAFGFMVKDVEDYKGDKVFGVKTNYTVFGMKVGRIISGIFTGGVFFIIPIILGAPLNVKIWCWVLGLFAGYLASRERFYELPLWALFFLMLIPLAYTYLQRDIKVNFVLRKDNPYSELLGMFQIDREKAFRELNEYLSQDPCDFRFFNQKLLYFLYHFPDSVPEYYERVKGMCRVDDRTFLIMGAYYFRKGDFVSARDMGLKALKAGGVEALAFLEMVEDSLGNYKESYNYSKLARKYKANYRYVFTLINR